MAILISTIFRFCCIFTAYGQKTTVGKEYLRRLPRILFKISGAAKVGSPNFASEDSEPWPRFLIVITS